MQSVRIAAAQDFPLNPLCKRPKLEITMDLHLLAQTAHALEASGTNTKGPSLAGHHSQQQQPSISGTTSHGPGGISDLAGFSGDGFRVPSMARSSDSGLGPNKQHKHRAAEQRRRERINEKLAQLRELVPHDQRSNTATFLEGVIAYIQSLQQSNIAMEAQLAALQRRPQQQLPSAAAAALTALGQQQPDYATAAVELTAAAHVSQPCLSGVGAAAAKRSGARTPHSSSPPCDGPDVHMPPTAVLLPPAAAAAASSHTAGARQPLFSAGALQALTNCNTDRIEAAQASLSGPEALSSRHVSGSSPSTAAGTPSPTAAVAATAASAPTAAVAAMPSSLAAAAAAAVSTAPGMQLQLQPAELQSVLEKALLNALQQQAQQLAAQLNQQ